MMLFFIGRIVVLYHVCSICDTWPRIWASRPRTWPFRSRPRTCHTVVEVKNMASWHPTLALSVVKTQF